MNEAELASRFSDATYHCEHHNADLNYVGKFALSEVPLSVGFKVVLTGEGADENFGGYPMYLPDYLRETDFSVKESVRPPEAVRVAKLKGTEDQVAEYYTSIGAKSPISHPPSLPRRMLNETSTPASMAAFQPPSSIFAPWCFEQYGDCDTETTVANNIDGHVRSLINERWHPLNSAMYVWSKGHLVNQFLSCLGDRTEMAHSIEARTPFLDHHLTTYVNNLPPSMKIRYRSDEDRFVEKYILREASKPFITQELYERKKHPYSAPTSYPSGGPLHTLFSDLITEVNVQQLGFLDWSTVQGIVKRAFEEQSPLAMRNAFCIAQWIVLGQRFGVKRAKPFETGLEATEQNGDRNEDGEDGMMVHDIARPRAGVLGKRRAPALNHKV